MLTGKHLIAGDWVGGDASFASDPAHGPARDFAIGTPAHVDAAVEVAEDRLAGSVLQEELFDPLGIILRVRDTGQMDRIARNIEGQLTCTLLLGPGDKHITRFLRPVCSPDMSPALSPEPAEAAS